MKILAGPLAFWRDHWAGEGGFGPPGGQGDWAATIHDYNWHNNGPDPDHGISIGMGLNPRLKPEVSKAFIQSNRAAYRHAGGIQGAKNGYCLRCGEHLPKDHPLGGATRKTVRSRATIGIVMMSVVVSAAVAPSEPQGQEATQETQVRGSGSIPLQA